MVTVAANVSGGVVGKMISPQSIAVAAAAGAELAAASVAPGVATGEPSLSCVEGLPGAAVIAGELAAIAAAAMASGAEETEPV